MTTYSLSVKPACKSRKEYIEYCKTMIHDCMVRTEGRVALQYKKNGKGQRVGVVVAFMLGSKLHIGASKCNRKLHDKFDSHIGQWQAIRDAVVINDTFPETYEELDGATTFQRITFDKSFPLSMHKLVCRMIYRARRQFGLVAREPRLDPAIEAKLVAENLMTQEAQKDMTPVTQMV